MIDIDQVLYFSDDEKKDDPIEPNSDPKFNTFYNPQTHRITPKLVDPKPVDPRPVDTKPEERKGLKRRSDSVVCLHSARGEYFGKSGCIKKTSTGRFIIELNPNSETCKKLIEDCPNFESTEQNLQSVNIGLTRTYLNSYNTFLYDLIEQAKALKDLYITSVTQGRVSINDRYFETITNFCCSTTSKIYLTNIELTAKQFKDILENAIFIETFEMMNCKITDLSRDFTLNDSLDYNIKTILLRGAIEKGKFRYFSRVIKKNANFMESLKSITVSKDVTAICKKFLGSTHIKIHTDPCNK